MIKIKRVYEKPAEEDGYRILVDKLWPRGMTKKEAKIDLWERDAAPSDSLRRWFAHDLRKWAQFKRRYQAELAKKRNLLNQLKQLEKEKKKITFIYAAKDEKHNNALALKGILAG